MAVAESLAQRITTRQLPADFRMLEIGLGSYPFSPEPTILAEDRRPHRINPSFKFDGDRSYMGVDSGTVATDHSFLGTPEEIADQGRRILDKFASRIQEARASENISFRFGNVLDLQLPEGAFNEVYMGNVLSSEITDHQIKLLLELSARVLVAGGLLVTRETFTPHLKRPETVWSAMVKAGFDPVDITVQRYMPEEFEALTDYYGRTIHDRPFSKRSSFPHQLSPKRYFCLGQKP